MLTIRNRLFKRLMFTSILMTLPFITKGQQNNVTLKIKVQNLYSTVTSSPLILVRTVSARNRH